MREILGLASTQLLVIAVVLFCAYQREPEMLG
jgi:hypothetical protein